MANVFDQFDTPVLSPQQGQPNTANIFDQFDEGAHVAKPPQGWMEYADSVARAAASGVTFGHADELAGALGSIGNKAMRAVGIDVPEISYSDIRDKEDQGIRDFRETNPVAAYGSEIGGSIAVPMGALGNVLKGGLTVGKVAKGAGTVGAPIGAVSQIGEAKNLDSVGDYVGEGLGGAAKGALAYGVLAPVAAGLTKGVQTAGKALRYARKPEEAALEKAAGALADDGTDLEALRAVVAPKGKEGSASRGLTNEQVSELVSRVRDGEDVGAIASGMVNPKTGKPFTNDTLNKYLAEYQDNTSVPMNLVDLSKSMPDSGGAKSITNLARAASSSRGKAQSTAAKALINRQLEQGGRVSEHLDRAAGGVNIEDEISKLNDVVGEQAKKAYGAARSNAQPFDLKEVISKWRGDAKGNDAVSKQLNEAIDTFFDPGMVEQVSAKTGKPMEQLRYTKLLEPTSDMDQFMRSRRGLDQMIDASKSMGKPTTLTRALTGMRRDLNNAARKGNDAWLKADTQFSEGKAGQAAIEMGEKLATRAGGQQRSAMEKFGKMSEEQKELFRLGFVRNLMDRVANKREGHDVTQELSTDGVKRVIAKVFPGKRGQRLIRDINQEGVTSDTLREVFSGSRTAPLMEDMKQIGQDAALVGNLLSGNVGGSLREAASRMMRGLNEKQSEEIIKVLTNTKQEDLLPLIDALRQAQGRLGQGGAAQALTGRATGIVASEEAGKRF
jgi:hypothetical protein